MHGSSTAWASSTRSTTLMISCLWEPLIPRKRPGPWPWPSGCWNTWGSQWQFTKRRDQHTASLAFLGILIDTDAFELRLPLEKIQRLQTLLQSWSSKKSCTRKELESLLGHQSHAASVVRPGRTFLCHLFSLLHLAGVPHHFFRPNLGARADLAWWKCFFQSWNGSSFFLPLPTPSWHVYSDALGTYGCAAVMDTLGWFQAVWPEGWEVVDIVVKELVPVVVAAALWGQFWRGQFWRGQHVCFHSDS